MREIIEHKQQEEPEDAPLHARNEGRPLVGMERATMLDTARASGMTPVNRSRDKGDLIFSGVVRASVWIFLAILTGIMVILVIRSLPTIQLSGLYFFTGDTWDPSRGLFGSAPAILDTILVAGIAMVLAGIVGLATAIYLVDFAPRWLREPVAFLIELLAYIPSVVYGLWALLVMVPWLQQSIQPWILQHLGAIPFFNGAPYGIGIMAASLILSIMLLPLIVSLSREALLLVPDSQREAMLAVGATRWEVLRHAVLPYARGGIFGVIILSLGRALGETMAVAMVIGGGHRFPTTIFDQGYTLSSVIANEFGEAGSELHLSALVGSGLILIVLTTVVNLAAFFMLRRMNRVQRAI